MVIWLGHIFVWWYETATLVRWYCHVSGWRAKKKLAVKSGDILSYFSFKIRVTNEVVRKGGLLSKESRIKLVAFGEKIDMYALCADMSKLSKWWYAEWLWLADMISWLQPVTSGNKNCIVLSKNWISDGSSIVVASLWWKEVFWSYLAEGLWKDTFHIAAK